MIVIVGLSHHTASIEIREQVALTEDAARELAAELCQQEHVAEVFVVSTCNRVEIIAASAGDDEVSAELCGSACRTALLRRAPKASPALYTHAGESAVRHLFRVAASLDSLVVGEAQILGQLKQGYESGKQASTVGGTLHQLFSRAARGAKRVRAETTIGAGQVSVPSIAIELAGQIFGDLTGRRAALIGSGEMGQTVARLLRDAGARLTIVGRTAEKVEALAVKMGGEARLMGALEEVLTQADIVVSSTSAMQPVVTVSHLERRKKARRGANLFFIDLAVPRDVAHEVGELDGVFLYDVDDLAQVAAESAGSRKNAAKHAEKIVEESVVEWARRQNAQAVTPTIKALRARMRRGLEEELNKSLRGRLRGLDEEQRNALGKMLDAGLNRILHGPVTRLRTEASREDGLSAEDLAGLLSELFELTEVPPEELDVSSVRVPDAKSKIAYLSESSGDSPTESKAKWKNDAS